MTLPGTFQIRNHFANSTAGIQFPQPFFSIGIGIIRSLQLLDVHKHDRYIQISDCRQHIIAGRIGQQLQNHEIYICGTEFVSRFHREFFGCNDSAVDNIYGIGDQVFEIFVLCLKFRHQGRKLGKICAQCNSEYADSCFGIN